jgi:hypothetical protein
MNIMAYFAIGEYTLEQAEDVEKHMKKVIGPQC